LELQGRIDTRPARRLHRRADAGCVGSVISVADREHQISLRVVQLEVCIPPADDAADTDVLVGEVDAHALAVLQGRESVLGDVEAELDRVAGRGVEMADPAPTFEGGGDNCRVEGVGLLLSEVLAVLFVVIAAFNLFGELAAPLLAVFALASGGGETQQSGEAKSRESSSSQKSDCGGEGAREVRQHFLSPHFKIGEI
jgi:hypothetical protein